MEVSFVIVTKNRAEALAFTLEKIRLLLEPSKHEVLVFVDGCAATQAIQSDFPWVKWYGVAKSIGASPARNRLYQNAVGSILIGLDDDAHPLTLTCIEKCKSVFENHPNLGIIAFQEVRGLFASDAEALLQAEQQPIFYTTNDFVGCGFAIKNEVYQKTNGFPLWMDIYGEETCVAYEVLNAGYDIVYDNSILVNHRVDKQQRVAQGKYYFRFQKQLKNTIFFFLVYRKNPFWPIVKTILHNFKKYALKDFTYFSLFWRAMFEVVFHFFSVLKYRKPLNNSTLQKIKNLQALKY
ncbi:glycosyltransferase family 2 protein [Flavobacterium difficile]|uniref:Glycosyltransferase n=1 Tax=Flavobacterium difficile TaxID=2709659 RepID=A0ABX0I6N6_9FLAO|nr:glycosyltransferase [Flavobacterium difficile]NHM01126.1 glycosyltransferase [Flavobacterium difficile]